MGGDPQLRMLTFAPTIDSETARLACRWYRIPYVEDDHLFGWVSLLALRHGGYGALPLIYGREIAITGSRQLIAHFDPLARPERRLTPQELREDVEADWSAYNVRLGHEVAVFAYFHLLAAPELMIPIFAAPLPANEARLTQRVYPALRGLFTVLLQLGPERAAVARGRIREVFAATDRRLADGRAFLQGKAMTLGDIAFAGAVAPLLQPAGFGAKMPEIDRLPLTLRQAVEEFRQHRTAEYVAQVYNAVSLQ